MKRKGFTLIELMIVVAIIGILLAMLLPRIGVLIDRSRERATGKNLKNIYTAIVEYAERKFGRMEWPALSANPNNELVAALTSETTTINPQGAAFEKEVPPALLRRGAKDGMVGGVLATQNNEFYAASERTWDGIAAANRNLGGWIYITAGTNTGEVFINSNVNDTFGVQYCTYPCW